ncbi:hypothetical protein BDZ88DRAFT_470977 [Geranomyces variabilis]|nr:hypothetical protein BDZ88DRAFT_470977 [Geranomyces variabilis]KAJ3133089.1 hypothetical protein HDU90_006431 [Geranomyces variabilis]
MRFTSLLAVAAACASSVLGALPLEPNNIVAFPNRDFITIEGFLERAGQEMKVEVFRGNVVVGFAAGPVSGGDVALEINHPGGLCWGAGTTAPQLQVTPDLQPGDRIQLSIAGTVVADSVIQGAFAEKVDYVPGALTFTVTGQLGTSISIASLESRIVNPNLVDTTVGRRDVRATAGDYKTQAFNRGYRSGVVESTAGGVRRYIATYDFDPNGAGAVEVARTAAQGGGVRVMTWQAPARQGLTIAELGEVGGPGMGGCPAGPAANGPGVGKVATIFSAGSVKVTWTTPTVIPGSAPITGYDVQVLPRAIPGGPPRKSAGYHTDVNVNSVTISDPSISSSASVVEVRSLRGAQASDLFIAAESQEPVTAIQLTLNPRPSADPSVPVIATSVTITSNVQIFFTTNGDLVLNGDAPSDSAVLYDAPILISQKTVLHVAAITPNGLFETQTVTYQPPPNSPPPQPPTGVKGAPAAGGATITWNAPTDTTITGYAAQTYELVNGKNVETGVPHIATGNEILDRKMTVEGLTPNVPVILALKSINKEGIFSAASDFVTVTPSKAVDKITIARARQQQRDLRVEGTGSDISASFTLHNDCNSAPCAENIGTATADATGAYAIRNKSAPAGLVNVWVKSSKGGIVGPQKVTQA